MVKHMIWKKLGLWGATLMAFSGLVGADTLMLKNGDQLRGVVLREKEDHLVFKAELLPQPLEIPRDSIKNVIVKKSAPATPPPVRPVPTVEEDPSLKLPENWAARVAIGFSDRQTDTHEHRETSAKGKLAWKGKRQEAEWKGFYQYHTQDGRKSTDRYGASQRVKHRGDESFYVQAQTKTEMDQVTKKRAELSQTAGLGFSPVKNDKITLNVTPGVKAEHIMEAENEEQNGTAYKAHVQQDLQWKFSDTVSVGQGLNYSVDPRSSENWDMDINAFVETKVSEDVKLRLNYRRDFLNQAAGAPDIETSEVGASLVWDF
ncbi:MAG: putative salt-induced outer membrane protein YdiY [Verrucomicrobiales bacterium]|jgi:putative salt-induced outer membrane protein YdiY